MLEHYDRDSRVAVHFILSIYKDGPFNGSRLPIPRGIRLVRLIRKLDLPNFFTPVNEIPTLRAHAPTITFRHTQQIGRYSVRSLLRAS